MDSANFSTSADLPTPASPTITALFLFLRERICAILFTSLSLPTTGSILPSSASLIKSLEKLSKIGAELMLSTINNLETRVENNFYHLAIKQNDTMAKYAHKIAKSETKINWEEEAKIIESNLHKQIGGNNRNIPNDIRQKLFDGIENDSISKLVLEIALRSSFDGLSDIRKWKADNILSNEVWNEISEKLLDRLTKQAEGILIAGPPGMGKSTFGAALFRYYQEQDKIIKAAKISTFLGTYSYGVYAFHILALEFYDYNVFRLNEFAEPSEWWRHLINKTIVVIIASTLATFLTLKLIDQPLQRRGRALIRKIFTPTT